MNFDLLLAIVFYGFLLVYFFRNRSKFEVHGKIFAMYRTKLGLKLMDKIALSFPRTLRALGGLSVATGFIGMVLIFYILLKGTWDLLFVADALPAVAPVLPGIRVMPGLPVLSFFHWILAILIVATIHEFSHGIFARLYKIKVKSSGFAFFGPILAAFVEPDEKITAKKPKYQQLAMFSAGPFSNILTAFVFMALMSFVTMPLFSQAFVEDGIKVHSLIDGYPMEATGVETPFIIKSIDGVDTLSYKQFANETDKVIPGKQLTIETDKGEVKVTPVENPDNASRGFIGVSDFEMMRVPNEKIVARFGAFAPTTIEWVHMLIFWLWVVSLGIGLFNLLPLGPVDGGRMLLTGLTGIMKDGKKAAKIWGIVSYTCVLLIVINLAPFLWKLLLFLLKPVLYLISLA